MSKQTLLTLLGCLCIKFCFSQTIFNTEKIDSTNIYSHALAIYCQSLDQTKPENKVVYVERNYLFTDKLPHAIKGIEIHFVGGMELRKAIKYNKGHLTLVRIITLRVEQSEFFVNVIPFNATYKKKNFNLKNSGGLSVRYKFNCELKGLVYDKSKWGEL